MNDGQIRIVIIGIYLLLLLGLGVMANRLLRSTKRDYLLASQTIGPFLLLMSLFGTTMTAFALIGSSGKSYQVGMGVYGLMASSSGIIHSLCFFLVGIKLWSLGRRYGYTTQIQYFRDRMNNDGVGLLLFPILVGLIIPYLLIGVMAGGTVIQTMTAGAFEQIAWFQTDQPSTNGGIPPQIGSLVICLVVLTYVFFGGMRGTAWANAFQTLVFIGLGILTFYLIATKLGGKSNLLDNLAAASEAVDHEHLSRSGMSQTKFFTYLMIPLSVGMFPHVFQHWLTAKSAETFKVPIVCHPLFIMILWGPCVLIGMWASAANLPSNLPANAVLPYLVNTHTGPIVGGLLAAGILAAIMSSLDSQFLCLGTIFSNDLVTHYCGEKRFSEKQQMWLARGFIIAIVAATYALSLRGYVGVFTMGIWCFSGFTSLFPLVLGALYWRRLTVAGVYASVIAAAAVWSYLFWQADFGANPQYTVDLHVGGQVYQTMPVVWSFLASLLAMVSVSIWTTPPKEEVLKRFFPPTR